MSLTDEQKLPYYLDLYKQLWHSFDARSEPLPIV